MTDRQLTMRTLREAQRVGEARDLLALLDMAEELLKIGYSEEVVAAVLDWPTQGNVTPRDRLHEALAISQLWPEDALVVARKYRADWHAMFEPARWWRQGKVEREEVVDFALEYVAERKFWPRADDMRRRFGFASGHKTDSENPPPGQEPLL